MDELPGIPREKERGRQKYLACPILLRFILSPGTPTKQNQWDGSQEMQIAVLVPCGTKQRRGKAGSEPKHKEVIDWHDPLRQGSLIPNL